MTAVPADDLTVAHEVLFQDDFAAGLDSEGSVGSDSRWQLRPAGTLPHGDGTVRTVPGGITVEPVATHPVTGAPCFAYEDGAGTGSDHMRWRATARHTASSGMPGYDAPRGSVLTVEAELAVETFGMDAHPFGDAVSDPGTDFRLGAGALIAADVETRMVFNFSLTDRRIYALYERFQDPVDKSGFCRAVPVADRVPGQYHRLAISYDRSAGTAVWSVDGREVLSVDILGGRGPADRGRLLIDEGGPEKRTEPRQLLVGVCTFTLQHAAGPDGGPALVGPSEPAEAHTPWGQGVRLSARSFTVHRTG